MIRFEDYTTEEQKAYLERIKELDKYKSGLNPHFDMMRLNKANCIYEINQAKATIQEGGLASIERTEENTTWRIEDTKKRIAELQKELAEYEEAMELIGKLKASGYNDILEKMCEDREKELAAVEYMEYWDVEKLRRSTGGLLHGYS